MLPGKLMNVKAFQTGAFAWGNFGKNVHIFHLKILHLINTNIKVLHSQARPGSVSEISVLCNRTLSLKRKPELSKLHFLIGDTYS